MAQIKDAALAHELKRWMRPDAHRFVRPDWRRFVRRGFEKDHPFALYERKYRQDQLRDDHGRWSDEAGGGEDDGIPDNAKPAQYDPSEAEKPQADAESGGETTELSAQGRRAAPPGGSATGGQAARLVAAEAEARDGLARVRELDPNWRPTPSIRESVEGQIAAAQAEAREARARLSELSGVGIGPGPYAGESIPGRGPERDFTAAERREINRIGSATGCHTCGTQDPGTLYSDYVVDHQIPTSLNSPNPHSAFIHNASRAAFDRVAGPVS